MHHALISGRQFSKDDGGKNDCEVTLRKRHKCPEEMKKIKMVEKTVFESHDGNQCHRCIGTAKLGPYSR